jgi:hypothetical protein
LRHNPHARAREDVRPATAETHPRRWGITAVEVVAGLVLVAVVMAPVLAHPNDAMAGALDAPYHAWLGWRLAELFRHGTFFTLTIPDAFAPNGFDLRLVDGLFPAWITGAFDLVTGGRMILSYNLALATGVGLDLWAGRRLAQVVSDRRWIWFVSGAAFATAPALAGSLGAHIAFVYAFPIPLLLREAILVARGDRDDDRLPWIRIGVLFAVAYLCSSYHLIFGAIAFAIVVVAWPRSRVRAGAVFVRLGGSVAVALVLLSPFIVARLSYESAERTAGSHDVVRTSESVAFSADALGAVTPPEAMWIDLPVPRADLGPQLYPDLRPAFVGYLLLVGLIGVAVARTPARRPVLITVAALWVLSLGPALHVAGKLVGTEDGISGGGTPGMPFRALQALPGLGALRAPTRASYAIAATLAVGLAVALDRLAQRLDDRAPSERAGGSSGWMPSAALIATTVLLLGCSLTAPVATSDLGLTAETRRGLEQLAVRSDAGTAADGIIIVPWGCRLDDPRIVALQTVHHRPNIGCNPPPSATPWYSGLDAWARSAELAALRCDQAHLDRRVLPFDGSVRLGGDDGVDRLRRDLGVRYVVIDRANLPPFGCDSVRDAITVFDRYEVVSDDGAWTIVDLDRRRT